MARDNQGRELLRAAPGMRLAFAEAVALNLLRSQPAHPLQGVVLRNLARPVTKKVPAWRMKKGAR